MNIFENNYEIIENTVVTLGKFDGLHEGHCKLIETTIRKARENGYKSLLYTFNQNPANVLKGKKIKQLLSREEKIHKLRDSGLDYVVFTDFTYEFSQMLAEEFVKNIIKKKLKAKMVIVGFNYRFGKDASGDVNLLKKLGKENDFEVEVIEAIKKEGEIISSSIIREKEMISSL